MSEIKCFIVKDDIGDVAKVNAQLMTGFEAAARREIAHLEDMVKEFGPGFRDDEPDPECVDALRMVRESIESGVVTCRDCGRAYSRLPVYHPGDDLDEYWNRLRQFKHDVEDVWYTWGSGCACRSCISRILGRRDPDDLL